MPSVRYLTLSLVTAAILTGCASPTVWNKSGATQQDFATEQYACERDSRQSGGFDSGLIGAIEVQGYFNRCMVAHGWYLQDKAQVQTSAANARATAQSVLQQRRACVTQIRENPNYQSMTEHFSDIQTGKYSFTQMSDPRIPTPSEVAVGREYLTQTDHCYETFLNGILPLASPAQAQVFRTSYSESQALSAQLVRREISWGDYSTRANQMIDANTAKLQAAR
jgi:hypothetical protein